MNTYSLDNKIDLEEFFNLLRATTLSAVTCVQFPRLGFLRKPKHKMKNHACSSLYNPQNAHGEMKNFHTIFLNLKTARKLESFAILQFVKYNMTQKSNLL